MSDISVNQETVESPRLSDLSLVLDKLARIEAALAKPETTLIISFSEVQHYYPRITPRELRAACADTDGPRKFKPGHVSIREIEAWIKRREQDQGQRST